jgi:hypothetical protein
LDELHFDFDLISDRQVARSLIVWIFRIAGIFGFKSGLLLFSPSVADTSED